MANLYYDVRVDIQKDIVIDSGLRFTQGDSKVIYLRLAVMNGSTKFDASNTTPSVNFVKPDGTFVVGTPVETGDFWVYQFLGNELQSAGKVLCDIKFTYESGRVSSSKFTFFVEKDTTITGAAASSSYVIPMEALLGEMQNYRNQGYSLADSAETSATTAATEAAKAKEEADRATAIVGIGIATTSTAGIVKPDGTTVTVDADGTIHSAGGGSVDIATTTTPGIVKPDGTSITIEADGTIHGSTSVDIDNTTITKNSSNQLQVANEITTKLGKIDTTTTATNGQALAWNGTKYTPTTIQGGISPSDMLSTKTAFENNTASGKVVDALVLKEWSNGYSKFVDFVMPANATDNTASGTSTILANASDGAYLEFFYELTLKSGSTDEYQDVTLASYTLGTGTDKGKFSITTVETLDVAVNCRIKVTEF